jgi:hypothetical protein
VVNVLALGGDDSIARRMTATIATVFSSVFELPLRNQRLLFGFPRPVSLEALRMRLDRSEVADLREVSRTVRARLRAGDPGTGDEILTDDLAPDRAAHGPDAEGEVAARAQGLTFRVPRPRVSP